MPPVFKSLATINSWALFIIGWISLIAGYVQLVGIYFGTEIYIMSSEITPVWMPLVGGFACLSLSVAIMKVRQMME